MRSESDSRFPLADLTVIDFSQVLAGPYAGRLFADLGADVIKIESPAGDLSRRIAPRRDRGMSGLYTWANVGKRNVCIDLTRDEGRKLALASKTPITLSKVVPSLLSVKVPVALTVKAKAASREAACALQPKAPKSAFMPEVFPETTVHWPSTTPRS